MNTWNGLGRLVRDPQTRTYGENNDKKMARFTIACERRGKREEGQQNADFIGCVCYGKLADFVDSYLRQGTKIAMRGHIQTGSYKAQDGNTVYTTDVIADEIEFAESKKATENASSGSNANVGIPNTTAKRDEDTGFLNIPDSIDEDEVPFH